MPALSVREPDRYLRVTKHQFKDNISKILRILRDCDDFKGVIITHYRKEVAMLYTLERPRRLPEMEG